MCPTCHLLGAILFWYIAAQRRKKHAQPLRVLAVWTISESKRAKISKRSRINSVTITNIVTKYDQENQGILASTNDLEIAEKPRKSNPPNPGFRRRTNPGLRVWTRVFENPGTRVSFPICYCSVLSNPVQQSSHSVLSVASKIGSAAQWARLDWIPLQ